MTYPAFDSCTRSLYLPIMREIAAAIPVPKKGPVYRLNGPLLTWRGCAGAPDC